MAKAKDVPEYTDLMTIWRSMREAEMAMARLLTTDRKAALAVCPNAFEAMKEWKTIGSRCLDIAAEQGIGFLK